MAILKGSSGSDAEFPFAIYDNDNVPQNGYSFSTGDVKYRAPGGSLVDADVANIKPCGNGQYVLQLTGAQTAAEGAACIVFDDGVNRPYAEFEMIASGVDEVLEIPFSVYNGSMVGQAGLAFTLGDLKIRLPNQTSFSNATLANIDDLGGGQYVLTLTAGERSTPGAIMVYFDDGVNQPYWRYELNAVADVPAVVTPPSPIPLPAAGAEIAVYAHAQAMLDRLPEYAKQEVL